MRLMVKPRVRWSDRRSDRPTNGPMTRLSCRPLELRQVALLLLLPLFILVPFLRIHISSSCRCQAKRMYLSLLWKQQGHFFESFFPLRDIEHWCRQTCSLSSSFGTASQSSLKSSSNTKHEETSAAFLHSGGGGSGRRRTPSVVSSD